MTRSVVRTAVVAFVVSRALIFALLLVGSQIAFLQKVYSNSVWETRIVLDSARMAPELARMTMIGDAWWYRTISLGGYEGRAVAFFPLYPLTVRWVSALGMDWLWAALLVSNLALLGALVLFGAVATAAGFAAEDAERAVTYLAFFPTAYFFSLPLTESLFLFLSLAAFLGALRERWWLAGLCGGLAALTRVPGALLLLPVLVIAWQKRARWHALWLLLVPAGTGAFMAFLYARTGDPLAFRAAHAGWGRGLTWVWTPIVRFFSAPQNVSEPWNFVAFHVLVAALLLFAAVFLFARREWALGVYTLASLLLPLASGSLQSLGRIAMVVFPLFLVLAVLGRARTADRVILAVSVILLGWLVALFTLRVDFALA